MRWVFLFLLLVGLGYAETVFLQDVVPVENRVKPLMYWDDVSNETKWNSTGITRYFDWTFTQLTETVWKMEAQAQQPAWDYAKACYLNPNPVCVQKIVDETGIDKVRLAEFKPSDFKLWAKTLGIEWDRAGMDLRIGYGWAYVTIPEWKQGEILGVSDGITNTTYWTTSDDCLINTAREFSNDEIVFTCDIVITANLTTQNITWQWNETSDNQYEVQVNSGSRWQSKDDTFEDYGATGYNLDIDVNEGGWANLSSVENCEADLYGINVYDGANFFVDDFYGGLACTAGYWHLYAQANATLNGCNYKAVNLHVDSTEAPAIYNFDTALNSGNMTTGNNVIKWINSGGAYWRLTPDTGATGTINITESQFYRVEYIRNQQINIVNSSVASYYYGSGTSSDTQLDNSQLTSLRLIAGNMNVWTAGATHSDVTVSRNFAGTILDFKGYINFGADPIAIYEGSVNRTYPICLYTDSYSTSISSDTNITLYNVNDTAEEGTAQTDASGCVNISVVGLVSADEFDTLEIRADGVGYRNISTFDDSTETVSGSLVGFKVPNVTAISDTTAPSWDELPTNQVAEYGTALNIEFNATDADTPPVVYTVNDTDNFAFGSSTGILTNNTYLSIGVYYLQLNATDSASPANTNTTNITITVSDNTNPTITWYNQTNSTGGEVDIDINTRRLLNLTWNLTDSSPINISSCSIQIRINDTTINSTEWLYENDTLSSNLNANGWWTHSCVLAYNNSDNTSISIYAELPNTLYYRATTMPIPIDNLANDTTDTIFGSNVVMLENSNATIEANYLYVTKHNINPKTNTKADSRQWYCNKTYRDEGWGDFRTSQYCGIGASISVGDTKVDGSDYFEKYGSSDENATFGGIGISDPSYFISEAIYANNENQGWAQKGTSGHSGHSYASDDYGVTWTLKPDTEFDMVIQWFNSMYFEARVNITDNEGNTIIDLQQDYFDTVNRAPEAAFKKDCAAGGLLTVYNECNISELGTLNISADFLDPDTNLVNCTFILLNNDSSYNQTLSEIETNTSYGICSFQYDTTAITNGDYYFKVNVTDGLLTGSDSTYDFVRIENPSPQPAPTLTNHTCTPGTFTLEITATYNASAHNASLNYGNTTALGTLLWNTTTGTSFTFNPTSLDQNTTYYYNFTSYNSTGDFLVNGTYNCTTNPYTPPTWTQDNAINIWLLILLLTLAMTLHLLGILIESSTINFTAYSLFILIGLTIMAAGIQIESGETATVVGDITTKIATFSIINTIFINSYGITILLYGLYGMITAYTGRKLEDDDEDREFNRQEEYFNERT